MVLNETENKQEHFEEIPLSLMESFLVPDHMVEVEIL
jgi:hypothetical protein